MKDSIKLAAQWLWMIPAMIPAFAHFRWSGPFLYGNGSSYAFELWAFIWFVVLFIPYNCFYWLMKISRKR